jgi:hypothetical protein
MSFNIPGYFLDQKTRKLYKITPSGPFSMPELRRRLQREEEEEKAAAEAALRERRKFSSSNQQPITDISQYLRKRSTCTSLSHKINNGITCLMDRLKTRSSIAMPGSPQVVSRHTLAEVTNDPNDYGEMLIATQTQLQHYGYQVDPQFRLWKSNFQLSLRNAVTSMHFSASHFDTHRDLLLTQGGELYRVITPRLPPLTYEEIEAAFMDCDGSIRDDNNPNIVLDIPSAHSISHLDLGTHRIFQRKKDLFWCSSVNDAQDRVVLGGDQKLYLLNSNFDCIVSCNIKSSVFSTYIPQHRSDLCWVGLRNGTIQRFDTRSKSHINLSSKFHQSSSIVKMHSLSNTGSGHDLLTVGMDGSVNIWDERKPKTHYPGHQPKQKDQVQPIYTLKGHVNESTRRLAFDLDLDSHLLLLSGSDHRVRLWSLLDLKTSSSSSQPIWTSGKYAAPIPAAKLMCSVSKFPRLQEGWTFAYPESVLSRKCPGVILFGAKHEEESSQCSIDWLTAVK